MRAAWIEGERAGLGTYPSSNEHDGGESVGRGSKLRRIGEDAPGPDSLSLEPFEFPGGLGKFLVRVG